MREALIPVDTIEMKGTTILLCIYVVCMCVYAAFKIAIGHWPFSEQNWWSFLKTCKSIWTT